LLLEDALVADGDLDRDRVSRVEARLGYVRELEDAAPLEVVALDVVWVEDGVCGIRVEVGWGGSPRGRDTPVEYDGALHVRNMWLRVVRWERWCGESTACEQQGRGEMARHGGNRRVAVWTE